MFGCVRVPIFCVDMWVRMHIHVCGIFGRADNARLAPIVA
nr:MAG TPA: 54S ribosomal protein [Caudoviricetes sp.]